MKRLILLLFLLTRPLLAKCPETSAMQLQNNGEITISFCDATKVSVEPGTNFTIVADDITIPVIARRVHPGLSPGTTQVETNALDAAPELVALAHGGNTVTIRIDSKEIKTDVVPTVTLFDNHYRYHWSTGPATAGDEKGKSGGTSATAATAGGTSTAAVRLQFIGDFAKGGSLADNSSVGLQTGGALSIDTTDQHDPAFIDNNRGSLGLHITRLRAGHFFNQGRVGIEARASKSFHQDVHDFDGVVMLAGWLPVLPSLNILNRNGNFVAPPLSFSVSYGYRNRTQAGDKLHGRVFEGSALYHVFAADRFNVDFNGTWTINQLSNRPVTTPKTQRMYKATISYLEDPQKGFSLLTTIEDGSAGVMLTKVRQYFVGLALSKINFSGGSGKP